MAKMDWKNSDVVKAEDMNQIGQEINKNTENIGNLTILNTNNKSSLVGAVNETFTILKDRFDKTVDDKVTLQPGLQLINAAKDSRFRLGEVRGRTLINLLGNRGSGESSIGWSTVESTLTIDKTVRGDIDSSLKLQANSTVGEHFLGIYSNLISVKAGNYYIVIGYVKPASGSSAFIRPITFKEDALTVTGEYIDFVPRFIDSSKFNFSSFAFQAQAESALMTVRMQVVAEGQVANFSKIAVYEITADEFSALSSMTPEEMEQKYSFVPSGIHGVDGPYATATSNNLLPPFYEWRDVTLGNGGITGPYEAVIHGAAGAGYWFEIDIPAFPDQTYTLTGDNSEPNKLYAIACDEQRVAIIQTYLSGTFTTPKRTSFLRVYINTDLSTNFVSFRNPMLVLGSEAKPFKPLCKSMLAFQMELHANPTDGSDPDLLFEQDEEYRKLAKWKKVVLDGSLNWKVDTNFVTSDYKPVYVRDGSISAKDYISYVTKYDGKVLGNRTSASYTQADQSLMYLNGIHIAIANTDSGWGPDYSPTQDEIKAYFWGWKMFVNRQDRHSVYNGNGEKAWVEREADGSISMEPSAYTVNLPTKRAPRANLYNLLYRLAKDAVEPVLSEGCLTLNEGNNLVEVGIGIVLREKNSPAYFVDNGIPYYWINDIAVDRVTGSNCSLKYATNDIRHIYKNNADEKLMWTTMKNHGSAPRSGEIAFVKAAEFELPASYSVTYIKLDTSPIQQITGSLAVNEKAQISNLTAGVAEALKRVSVVEQKKADEDAPGWITPTLLNGWTASGIGYKKEGNTVYLKGALFAGVKAPGISLFNLPEGYRPNSTMTLILNTFDGGDSLQMVVVDFMVDGTVRISSTAYNVIIFNSIFFFTD